MLSRHTHGPDTTKTVVKGSMFHCCKESEGEIEERPGYEYNQYISCTNSFTNPRETRHKAYLAIGNQEKSKCARS